MKRIYLITSILLVIVIVPFLLWFFQSSKQLNVAIIDKTVPNESFREHLGITWVLNHFKYEHNNGIYNEEEDYFGTLPDENNKKVTEKPLPANYESYDVIYLADTYGVYEDDFKKESERLGARTERITGGLEVEEWNNIVKRLADDKKSLFIAEYNSIASPTSAEVRQSVLDYLEIDWSGWVGRYFDELDFDKNKEIPQWIVDEFGESWTYEGGGFVLVNDFTFEVIVLEFGKHIDEKGIRLEFTDKGKSLFGIHSNPKYEYWFDIVTANNEEQILANYQWSLTESGQSLLEEQGIPSSFAAVVSNERKLSTNYYFAGDFNDVSKVPSYYKITGLSTINKIAQKFSNDSFYWSAYVPMMKKIISNFEVEKQVKDEKKEKNNSNIQYNARVHDQKFEVLKDGKWEELTFKGVNMGMGKPGYFPGEAAITEEEYYRWFKQIADMNANTIRVYTLHPPGFYKALARYNEEHDVPLYLLHGVWIEEEGLEETLDAYDEETLVKFRNEMETLVDVIHGNKYVEPKVGHASGFYDANISEYVVGWIIGIEWYPHMVVNTNKVHEAIGQYDGQYFKTENATPFEYWLAENMDYITKYEYDHYKWIRPMSFTNWVTTDLLDHPSEPHVDEDLVSVNPNVIFTKGLAIETDQFASYHVYPYYPDFFNYDEKYLSYVDHRGKTNSYAGYLADLRAAHEMPVLVAEFGIPGSRGLTHDNPYGWTQGFVSEQQQGEILAHLFEDIMVQGYLGGLVFTWQDEWFKRTWNTMDYDNPDRRPYWSNAQTNEEQFGLLSFDRHKIQVDGDISEWETNPIYEEKGNKVTVDSDERYLYIQIDSEYVKNSSPKIVLDVVPNQGKHSISHMNNVSFSNGIEFVVELYKDQQSRVLVDPYYDFYSYLYGYDLKMIATSSIEEKKNSNVFTPILYALNKELFLPEQNKIIPFHAYETGKLIEGNGNPSAEDYNSLVDYSWNNEDGIIELRIPWLLIQSKDPSQKEFIGDAYKDGEGASIFVEGINIGVLFIDDKGDVIASLPKMEDGKLDELKVYSWDNWNVPKTKERLKESYYIMQEAFQ